MFSLFFFQLRICHCEGDTETPLIAPCYCAGSLRYVHQSCLQQWIKSSDTKSCELCKFNFIMHSKIKPFNKVRNYKVYPVLLLLLFVLVLCSPIPLCPIKKFVYLLQWERLDMSGMERRKIACSVTFHIVAITCVVWSLYVLIERTTEEVQVSQSQYFHKGNTHYTGCFSSLPPDTKDLLYR